MASLTESIVWAIRDRHRADRLLTIRGIAEASGVARSTVRDIIGKPSISEWPATKLHKICRALGIDLAEIVREYERKERK